MLLAMVFCMKGKAICMVAPIYFKNLKLLRAWVRISIATTEVEK